VGRARPGRSQRSRLGHGLPAVLLSLLASGCGGSGGGHPIEASLHPLNHARPAGVLTATLSGFADRKGKIAIIASTGEKLEGEYAVALDAPEGFGSVLALGGVRKECMADAGRTTDTKACGIGLGTASLAGDLGTTMVCEFLHSPSGSGWGACRSSRGTIYRMIY